jgi:RNA-dependent RNA polymerase
MLCLDINNCIPRGEIGVYFRGSMKKFTTENFSIDVVRMSSHPSLAYLNRQIILLLSSLGIPDHIFLSLQDRMLQQLMALTGDPRKAREALKDLNEFGGNGCQTFLMDYLRILGKQKEPFARRILSVFQAFLLKELRTKSKILVPNAWSLFGVIDETRTLNYGEVFIQIDNSNQQGGSSKILQGPVIVTRNPCFHPGIYIDHVKSVSSTSFFLIHRRYSTTQGS